MEWLKARSLFYPTLCWNMLLGRWLKKRNWWDRIDPQVILGALPLSKDIPYLAAEGVGAVVNTCEEYRGPLTEYEKFGINEFYMPTVDFTHPEFDDVCRAVEFIDAQIAKGKTVYIHCKAGRGRSATVAICWLIKSRQITAEQAQACLTEKRPHVNQFLVERPVVQRFEKTFLQADDNERS
jgi:atypical dual specificity phosphatase